MKLSPHPRRSVASLSCASVMALWVSLLAGGCGPQLGTPPQVCSTTVVNAGRSELMEPGGDCIGCHADNGGPGFLVAGTVMAALNDDTNCAGVDAVTVTLTGSDNRQTVLTTNSSGNFYARLNQVAIAFPYSAEVTRGGATTRMLTPRSAGETNCASCHTATGGGGAMGRIVAP